MFLFQNPVPSLEVIAVDPSYLYPYDNEDSNSSVSDNASEYLDQPEPCGKLLEQTTSKPKVQFTEPTTNDVAQSCSNKYADMLVQLVDEFFDFVESNMEEEYDLLKEIESVITDQSESLSLQPSLKFTSEDNKTHADIFTDHPIEVENPKVTTNENRRERRNLKRQLLEHSSEDECGKSKKLKVDDDPLWMPAEKPNNASNSKFNVRTEIRHGIGRGKNIETLTKYYKPPSSDNANCENNENRISNNSLKEAINTKERESKVQDHNKDRNNKQSEKCNNGQKTLDGHKNSTHRVKDSYKNADLSDFEKAIIDTMYVTDTRKPNVKRRNNSQILRHRNQFQEHSVKYQKYLNNRVTKSRICRPLQSKETVTRMPAVSSEIIKTGGCDNMEVPKVEHQPKMQAEEPSPPTKNYFTREVDTIPQSSTSKPLDSVTKRKITVQEYLKRKMTQQS